MGAICLSFGALQTRTITIPTLQLIGDIGGTNARFALVENGVIGTPEILPSAAHPTLESAIETFLRGRRPTSAALAVAAPVTSDRLHFTNLSWSFSIRELAARFGFAPLLLLNDFEAMALSVARLAPTDLRTLGGGTAVAGTPRVVVGPGSGLGMAGLVPMPAGPDRTEGASWIALPGEGGHTTLPATDSREADIIAELGGRFGHVSAERVLSGNGLVNLYQALASIDRASLPAEGLPTAAEITDAALAGTDSRATEAVNRFCGWLGTVAGNAALLLGARGGVYIAGGIVPRLGPLVDKSPFRARFEAKGRMQAYLAPIPTLLVLHQLPAFLGLLQALEQAVPATAEIGAPHPSR